ncbi:MAG: dihydrodipicolinate synthase family protein [Thermoplasmatales archaeon]
MPELKGIITPTITPMKGDTLDYDAVDSLIEFLGKTGVNGIYPMGSTGAFPIVSVEQQVKILEYFMDKKKQNMYFLAGVGRNSFDETLTMGLYAKELGVDAVSIVTPYYLRISQDAIFKYYERLLSKIDIPVLIYNIPQNTGNDINHETLMKLRSQFSHLVGIKDSSGNLSNLSAFLFNMDKDFKVFQGQDDVLLPSLAIGAAGGICGTSNFSDLSVRVFNAFQSSNLELAKKLQAALTEVKRFTNSYDFPQAHLAAFVEMVYHNSTSSPFPLVDLDQDTRKNFAQKIREILARFET